MNINIIYRIIEKVNRRILVEMVQQQTTSPHTLDQALTPWPWLETPTLTWNSVARDGGIIIQTDTGESLRGGNPPFISTLAWKVFYSGSLLQASQSQLSEPYHHKHDHVGEALHPHMDPTLTPQPLPMTDIQWIMQPCHCRKTNALCLTVTFLIGPFALNHPLMPRPRV